ncbi:MAG TPA: hypothetical protein VKU80_03435 [Planctomycetota bacterium]|nr:hypothetical protein [Planctomycetota bacterium]
MFRNDEKKKFMEVRIFVSDRDNKPSDLSLVTASLLLVSKSGDPMKRDLQLLMPDPPVGVPPVEARSLPDGHLIRLAVAEFAEPFQAAQPAAGTPSVYFKADVPEHMKGSQAAVTFHFPTGKQKLELGPLSAQ